MWNDTEASMSNKFNKTEVSPQKVTKKPWSPERKGYTKTSQPGKSLLLSPERKRDLISPQVPQAKKKLQIKIATLLIEADLLAEEE